MTIMRICLTCHSKYTMTSFITLLLSVFQLWRGLAIQLTSNISLTLTCFPLSVVCHSEESSSGLLSLLLKMLEILIIQILIPQVRQLRYQLQLQLRLKLQLQLQLQPQHKVRNT